jgi:O-antigen/teichoic acid export membrane protein
MIEKRRVNLNATASALQVLVGGVTLFFLYRFLLRELGEESVGVWSLVLATTSAASIANLGLASSTIKFVSQHLARQNRPYTVSIVETATLTLAGVLAVFLLVAYPLLVRVLPLLIDDPGYLAAGIELVPYALISLWVTSVAGVLQSSIDGCQRVDLRGYSVAAGSVVYLAMAYVLVPAGGLLALAYAQLVHAAWLLIAAYVILKRLLPELAWIRWTWRKEPFREMLSYTLKFQVISISQLLLEPVTKSLVSRFGGLETLAYVELAHRMVFQFRSLVATAHRAIVPTIAHLTETAPAYLRKLYVASFRLLTYIIVGLMPLLISLSPWISRIWIQEVEPVFVVSASLLYVGWFLNLMANPAYFANLGSGALYWNVVAHLGMGGVNVLAGYVLGSLFGWLAVVGVLALSIIGGGVSARAGYPTGRIDRPPDHYLHPGMPHWLRRGAWGRPMGSASSGLHGTRNRSRRGVRIDRCGALAPASRAERYSDVVSPAG